MKFVPKHLTRNHNVSNTHPLVELLWLVSGLVLIAGVLFVLLGAFTDLAVTRIPVEAENWLGRHALIKFKTTDNVYLQNLLDSLTTELPADSPIKSRSFHVSVTDQSDINAIALPGGNIIIFSGLLQNIKSENELVMVLGHELGHYARKDHLRGLGRGLGITLGTLLLFGKDSATSEIVSNSLLSFQGIYSREQESNADQYGLSVLVRHFRHAGGATAFFTRLAKTKPASAPYLFASHPDPQDRIDSLKETIRTSGYAVRPPVALPDQSWTNRD